MGCPRAEQRVCVLADKKLLFLFFFLINCWGSVVASVVLPQLCKSPLSNFFFENFLRLLPIVSNRRGVAAVTRAFAPGRKIFFFVKKIFS